MTPDASSVGSGAHVDGSHAVGIRALRDVRRIRVEACVLVALALAPMVPHVHHLLARGIDRFALDGDYAGLETAIRFVSSGRTLLGPYSRFGWNHPGPLWFFVAAPFYALFGGRSTGLYFAASMINALAVASIVIALRRFAGRIGATAGVMVVMGWLAAFGNTCVLPWNPVAVALPLLAFFVFAALFARGEGRCAVGAALAGMLVTETHISTVPTVAVVSVYAVAAFTWSARKRRSWALERRWIATAGGIVVLALIPVLIEQVTAGTGNLTKLLRFFLASRTEPKHAFSAAFADWAVAAASLFDRALSRAIVGPDALKALASEPVGGCSSGAAWLVSALALATGGSVVIASRRRNATAQQLLVTAIIGTLTAIASLRAVVGPVMYYLVFWMTAPTAALSLAIFVTLFDAAPGRSRAQVKRALWPACLGALLVITSYTVWIEARAVEAVDVIPRPDPGLRAIYEALRARIDRDGATPIVHVEQAWYANLSLLLELSRDGRDAAVEERDRWILGRQHLDPARVSRPIHVWAAEVGRFDRARCTERIAATERFELFVSDRRVERCE